MSRHSKNNTAHSVFTYAEKKMLKDEYGTNKKRIGQDSQRSFEQCNLCLQTVKDPMVCGKGHLFCKTCILDNLLAQKKSIASSMDQFEKRGKQKIAGEVLRKRDFKELETKEFDKDNTGFGAIKKVKEFREKYDKQVTYDDEQKQSEDTKNKIKAITDQQILEFDNKELKHNLI